MSEHDHPAPPLDGESPAELFEDRYLLGQVLGRGGTCTVQRAWDTRLNRHVAIKRLEPPLTDDAHARARFSREGKAIARLSHPNLVTLIDRGGSEDESYLVFEYVDGRSLKDLLKSAGRLESRDAGQIAGQIAEGLAHAHSQGIIHRDVKPHNVLLDAEGRTKLTDFGIATGEEWTRVTREGSIVGSSRYMSPEQVQGRPVDQRTDIYSLGIVLYEMLTGAPPFQGSSIAEVGRQHIRTAPTPLSELVPDIPPAVERVVMRCLEKLPENRFQSADELLGALVGIDLYAQPQTPGGILGGLRRGGKAAADDAWVPPPGTESAPPPNVPAGTPPVADLDLEGGRTRRADVMRRRREKRRAPSWRMVAGVAGVVVIAVAAWWLLAGRGAAAPDLVGSTVDQARAAAEEVGLKVELVEQVLDLALGVGVVVAQEPAVGEKVSGGVVQLTVTREPIPVNVTALDDYDPEGDDEERPELLEQLIDDNDDTGWSTEGYRSAEFGNIPGKTGVGVSFRLNAPADAIEVVSHSEGWSAEVQSLSADGSVTVIGTLDGKARQTLTFPEPIDAGRIWITALAPGENDRFMVQLAEVRFFR